MAISSGPSPTPTHIIYSQQSLNYINPTQIPLYNYKTQECHGHKHSHNDQVPWKRIHVCHVSFPHHPLFFRAAPRGRLTLGAAANRAFDLEWLRRRSGCWNHPRISRENVGSNSWNESGHFFQWSRKLQDHVQESGSTTAMMEHEKMHLKFEKKPLHQQ